MKRVCRNCSIEKNIDDFPKEKSHDGKYRYRHQCKECRLIEKRNAPSYKASIKNNGEDGRFKPKIIIGDPRKQIKYCKKCGSKMFFTRERTNRGIKQYEYECKECQKKLNHARWERTREKQLPKMREAYKKRANKQGIRSMDDIKANKKTQQERQKYKHDWENSAELGDKYLERLLIHNHQMDKEMITDDLKEAFKLTLKIKRYVKQKNKTND